MAESNGNGLEFKAGADGAAAKATGGTTVNVLLAMLIIASSFYGVWTTNQQTVMINQEHYAIMSALADLTRANENVFLSTILTPEQKKDLPQYVQQRAKEIVERKAKGITDDRNH